VAKTEFILFGDPHKIVDYNIRLKLNGKLLNLSNYIKYST